jgi:excisionase family DNA binding protein
MKNLQEKTLYSIKEVGQIIGIGRTRIYQELNAGGLKAVKVGKRTFITKESLDHWLDSLENYLPQSMEA